MAAFVTPQIILVSLAFPFATAWAVVAVVVRTHVAQAQACLEAPVLAQHPLVAVGKARAVVVALIAVVLHRGVDAERQLHAPTLYCPPSR